MVDTKSVAGRRTLRFESLDQIRADVELLARVEREARLQQLGNWTLGQALGHLATWMSYAYDGPPAPAPWFVKVIVKTLVGKDRFINQPMRVGVRIPRIPNGTHGTDVITTVQGLERLLPLLERLSREAPAKPHSIFGLLTHDEWMKSHLRHAELHLSFFRPSDSAQASQSR